MCHFPDSVRQYALGKKGAAEKVINTGITVRAAGRIILRLKIRRGTPVACFKLEHEQAKQFRRNSEGGSAIRVKETEVPLTGHDSVATACGMVDLMVKQVIGE